MQMGSPCGLDCQRVCIFRSDCGPAACCPEHMVDFAQGDQELGRSSGCQSQRKPFPLESFCLPCPESAQVMLPQLTPQQPPPAYPVRTSSDPFFIPPVLWYNPLNATLALSIPSGTASTLLCQQRVHWLALFLLPYSSPLFS